MKRVAVVDGGMMVDDSYHVSCKRDGKTGDYLLVDWKGVTAGWLLVDMTRTECMLVVLNSKRETVLVVKRARSQAVKATILVPRGALGNGRKGMAVYGNINQVTSACETIYEARSATGVEIMHARPAGFPRCLEVIKANKRVATIESKQATIHASVQACAIEQDVLVIIGLMLATCIPVGIA
ncbi:MAG: hypothetical protein GYA24_02070 [Candidatus Lokiarchaeota archaeon]|nr:hypothetical protein [Candidatus Lokiarchaeota archaeon]